MTAAGVLARVRSRHGRFIVCRRPFHDRTLQWAKANPELAQQCLEIPPLAEDGAAAHPRIVNDNTPPRTFESYWKMRGWTCATLERHQDRWLGRSLATHVLSAPLTLVSNLLLPRDPTVVNTITTNLSACAAVRLCCVGARAEASLPLQYWREMLVVMKWSSPVNVDLTLDFVGPDVVLRPPVTLEFTGSTLTLRWLFPGKFHDYLAKEEALGDSHAQCYHGFVLFNPGLGHPNLKSDWAPTIDLLLLQRQQHVRGEGTVLFTAHSELDADRESKYLKQNFDLTTDYRLNPFASEITYEDPFDKSHMVRPNHFAALF